MTAPPARNTLSGTPTNAQFNTGIGALYDYTVGLLGADGTPAAARAALDAVGLTGSETIAGVKTFSSAPVVPDDSFTFAKMQNIPTATILGRNTAGTGDVEALTGAQATALLSAASETVSGRVELADATEAAAGTNGTRALSPLRLRDALAATGSAPIYACRAWVNFNGTETVAIRANGNVSSITDNGVGDYTVHFTTAMPDANYAPVCTAGLTTLAGAVGNSRVVSAGANTTASFRLSCAFGGNMHDFDYVTAAIFR